MALLMATGSRVPALAMDLRKCGGGGVDVGLVLGGHGVAFGEEALGEGAGALGLVPVEAGGEAEALGDVEAEGVRCR